MLSMEEVFRIPKHAEVVYVSGRLSHFTDELGNDVYEIFQITGNLTVPAAIVNDLNVAKDVGQFKWVELVAKSN